MPKTSFNHSPNISPNNKSSIKIHWTERLSKNLSLFVKFLKKYPQESFVTFTFIVSSLFLFLKENPTASGDTEAYIDQASAPFFSAHLWLNHVKPPLTALLLKITGGNWEVFTWTQWGLYLFSVLYLAFAFRRFLKNNLNAPNWLLLLSQIFLLGMGLSIDLFFWNRVILSESLTISGFLLVNAGVLYKISNTYSCSTQSEGPVNALKSGRCFSLIPNGLFFLGICIFALSRDANIYQMLVSLILSAFLFFVWGLQHRLKLFVPWAMLIFVLFIFNHFASNYQSRWARPLVRLFYDKVLYLENDTRFYVERGMPRPNFLSQNGVWTPPSKSEVVSYADSRIFLDWLETDGKAAFFSWIFSDPFRFWKEVFSKEILTQSLNRTLHGYTESSPPKSIHYLSDFVFFPKSKTAALWAIVIFIVFLFSLRRRLFYKFWVFPLVSYLSIPPLIFLNHHTCAIELARHTLIQSLQFRLMLWIVLFVALAIIVYSTPLKERELRT